MAKSTNSKLVIVESPAKAKTIEKYLGKDYKVISSFGHIRDLPKGKMGIDIDANFEPNYIVPKDKSHVARDLKAAAKQAEEVILASDEDREGEAIAWHISQLLKLKPESTKRIVFHEITEPAIKYAIENPRNVDSKLVDAQQARRILDRLVGYELSPLLWRKIRRGLSAGRVQSVAVRLIVEKEEQVKAHKTNSSYKLNALLVDGKEQFEATLKNNLKDKAEAEAAINEIISSKLVIEDISKTPQTRKAPAPFTTSSLQQAASSQLKMSVKQTMMLAQRLYEAGHITYMRTDSTALSNTAKAQIRQYILKNHGNDYVGTSIQGKAIKGAQEAHEAIRPTDVNKLSLGNDSRQKALYELIRKRAVASMMMPAKLEKTEVSIKAGKYNLMSSGVVIVFAGFMAEAGKGAVKETEIPGSLKVGDSVEYKNIVAEEKLKKPPARYSEASLVKELESLGIGRPSTYAPTISTIQDRGYVEKTDIEGEKLELTRLEVDYKDKEIKTSQFDYYYGAEKNRLAPTDMGKLVNGFLFKNFPSIVDYEFTADVENKFDAIAEGSLEWQAMIGEFYKPFHKLISEVDESVSREDTGGVRELGVDPKTSKKVYARLGRYGPMIQLGEGGDDDNPPTFAPFPKGKKLDEVTLEEALKMLELPRTVGKSPDNEDIEASIGRYGPYVKVGKTFISIDYDEVFNIDVKTAMQKLADKKKQLAKSEIKEFTDEGIKVKTGRFGPYVTDGKVNASIPKKINPEEISLEQAQELLEKKKSKK